MAEPWPLVRIGDVLTLQRRWLQPEVDRRYTEIGVRSYGRGIFHKAPVTGADLGTKRVLRIESGDLVLMNVFAWEGAVAVAGDAEDGTIGSHRYATYTADSERCSMEFLNLYFKTEPGRDILRRVSPGSAGRNRTLNLAQFATQSVPLPPIDEQRRIVARVEAIAAKADEAQRLREEAESQGQSLLRSMLFAADDFHQTQLEELLELREPDIKVDATAIYQFAGVYSFGRGVFVGEAKSGMEISYPRLTRLRTGDFVYPKLMAWEGAYGVVPAAADGCAVSTEFPVFRIRSERVLPEVIDVYFRTPAVWESLAGGATGTNVRRRRLHPSVLLATKMPLPPMTDQLRLADASHALTTIGELRHRSAGELALLMPTVLDRAFRGEL